jgi:lipid A 3-O-deacylase
MNTRVIGIAAISLLTIVKVNATPLNQEIRLGVMRHDTKADLKFRYEKGYDVNLEYLFASPCNDIWDFILSPRPHVGASINTSGDTSQIYAGLTWHVDFLSCLFTEFSFGGATHNGKTKRGPRKDARCKHEVRLGSRVLFRESLSLGVQFATHHSLSIMWDHVSNAGLANPNKGLTSYGIRYGYLF